MKHTFKRTKNFAILLAICILPISVSHASGAKMPEIVNESEVTKEVGKEIGEEVTNDVTDTPKNSTTFDENYSHLDPDNIVPKQLLGKALKYFDQNKAFIKNKNFIGVIDFSQHSSKERFYIVDLQSGRVETYQTAHGKNSDPDHNGYATEFSNVSGSLMSSQGIYTTAETYYGGHGYSLMLDGKSSTNSNARSRAIVIHPADYVQPGGKIGRSWGCPALDPRYSEQVIDQIKGGAVIYAQ